MKEELQQSAIPNEEQLEYYFSNDQSANKLMEQSSVLRNLFELLCNRVDSVSSSVEEGILKLQTASNEKRFVIFSIHD